MKYRKYLCWKQFHDMDYKKYIKKWADEMLCELGRHLRTRTWELGGSRFRKENTLLCRNLAFLVHQNDEPVHQGGCR